MDLNLRNKTVLITGGSKGIGLACAKEFAAEGCNLHLVSRTKEDLEKIKKHTDRPIKVRNKPRPGNEWWNTDVKDDLKDAWCVVTNMSLSAVDGVLNMTPGFTHQRHVASLVTSRKIDKVDKPFKPGRKTIQEWLNMVANHQFTLQEIEDGLAYETLKVQYQSDG